LEVTLAPLPERRAHRRVDLRLDVDLEPFGHRRHHTVRCSTDNVGEGGLSLWAPESLKAGRRAVASILLSPAAAILALVEILDSNQVGANGWFTRLKFTTLPWDARQRLRQALALEEARDPVGIVAPHATMPPLIGAR
jgi:hypothetical protein